jgi:hypothetical protein
MAVPANNGDAGALFSTTDSPHARTIHRWLTRLIDPGGF